MSTRRPREACLQARLKERLPKELDQVVLWTPTYLGLVLLFSYSGCCASFFNMPGDRIKACTLDRSHLNLDMFAPTLRIGEWQVEAS